MLLPINSDLDLFMLGLGDSLVSDSGEHTLMNGGVVVTVASHELGHGLLGGVHCVLGLCGDHVVCWEDASGDGV